MFGSKKIIELKNELNIVKQNFDDYVQKTFGTWDEMFEMFDHERGGALTISRLTRDFSKIGDVYLNNLYVRKCIDKIAGTIAQVEFDVVDDQGEPLPESHPAQKLFHYINEEDSPYDFVYEIIRSLERHGKVFIRSSDIRGSGGMPVALDILDAGKMKAHVENGLLVNWEYGSAKKPISSESVLFIRYKHPENPFDGLSQSSAAVMELLQQFFAQAFNIRYFKGGAMGSGFFKAADGKPLTSAQQREAQMLVDQTFNKGVAGAGEANVAARRALEFVKTGDNARDMQFHTLMQDTRDAIYQCFDVPKVIFLSSESTFSNLYEAKKLFWNQKLLPIIKAVESAFASNFFARLKLPYFLRFRVDQVKELQDDYGGKLDSALKMQALGIPLSIISEKLGLDLPEDIDSIVADPDSPPTTEPVKSKDEIIAEYEKERRLNIEKQIPHDENLKKYEYKSALGRILGGEKKIQRTVTRFFRAKYKDAERKLKSADAIQKAGDKDSWIASFTRWLDGEDWGLPFAEKVGSDVQSVFNRGAKRSYTGVGMRFNMPSIRAMTYAGSRLPKLKNVTDEFKNIVNTKIAEVMGSESWTIETMTKEISKSWKDATTTRARLTARTETTGAYNGGRLSGMKELGIKKKEWLHSRDGKVRDSHRIEEIVGTEEMFTLADGERVMFPGEGSAKNVCNCRCTIVSVL